ncbi:MAG: hypothetical protein ER33_08345 [Cyanobium sp. CACIAM 14]|nr:MAG: hypothetical protein ER33_08345 [Cyanobium sp. CACIAM 14]
MKERYVVDTNVLIAASAADPLHPKDIDATPADPELRRQVWQWLRQFRESSARLVLDQQQEIYREYRHKLDGNDYGLQVVIHKLSTCAADIVSVAYDADGNALLPSPLETVVQDRSDRKMVAACLASIRLQRPCLIAFAGDTDWHDWEEALREHGVELEPIIEAWSRRRHAEKQHR